MGVGGIYTAVYTRINHTSSRRKSEIIKDLRKRGKLLNNNLETRALTGVTQLAECCPAKEKVRWSDSWSEHKPGLQVIPQLRTVREASNQCLFHTSMFPSLPLKINK